MRPVVQNLLLAYAVVSTTAIGVALAVAHAKEAPPVPGVLTVQQIRIVEPDGTLRTVISNRARFPDLIVGGKTYSHPRGEAGALFFDDEGSEIGGLIYNGKKDGNGKVSNGGSLTFDRYRQDQAVQVVNTDDGDQHYSGLRVVDRPDEPLDVEGYSRAEAMRDGPAKKAAYAALAKKSPAAERLFVGRMPDHDAVLALSDGHGRKRLVLAVSADGTAVIRFLDAEGRTTKTVDATTMK